MTYTIKKNTGYLELKSMDGYHQWMTAPSTKKTVGGVWLLIERSTGTETYHREINGALAIIACRRRDVPARLWDRRGPQFALRRV